METFSEQLKQRTKQFALDVIELFRSLPRTEEARIIGRQLLRSATSVAANYRATRRARSRAEFLAKLGLVEEEADETVFWIELLRDSNIVDTHRIQVFESESNQLLAIFAASWHTARSSRRAPTTPHRNMTT